MRFSIKTGEIILCCLVFLSGVGCGSSGKTKIVSQVPDFRIAELQDTSTRDQKRFSLKIILPAHYSESSVKSTLVTIVNTVGEPDSEITLFFYGPDSNMQGSYDVARVVWRHGLSEIDYKPPITAK
jgi:hypothetical protein